MKLTTIIALLLLFAAGCNGKQPATTTTTPSPQPKSTTGSPQPTTSPSAAAVSAITKADADGAVTAAKQLYDLHFKKNQAFNSRDYQQWLTPELYQMLQKDEQESAKFTGEIAGLDFNPLTSAQEDVGEPKIAVSKASAADAELNVNFGAETEKNKAGATLILQMVKNGDKWQIKNIRYPDTGGGAEFDLITTLKELQKGRDDLKKSK